MQLIVIEPFLSFKKGDLISEPGQVAAILSTEDARSVAVLGTGSPVLPPEPSSTPRLGLPLLTPPQLPSAGLLNGAFTTLDAAIGRAQDAARGNLTWTIDNSTVFASVESAVGPVPVATMPPAMTALMNAGGTVIIHTRLDPDTHPQADAFGGALLLPGYQLQATGGRVISQNHKAGTVVPFLAMPGFDWSAWDGNAPTPENLYQLRDLSNTLDVLEVLTPGLVAYLSATDTYNEGVKLLTPGVPFGFQVTAPVAGVIHRQFIPSNTCLRRTASAYQCMGDGTNAFTLTLTLKQFTPSGTASLGSLTLDYPASAGRPGILPTVTADEGWAALEEPNLYFGGIVFAPLYCFLEVSLVSGTPAVLVGGGQTYRQTQPGALFAQDNL